jgi:hypothetical protein
MAPGADELQVDAGTPDGAQALGFNSVVVPPLLLYQQ